MSYSFDFCVKAASDKNRSDFADRDWSKAIELDSQDIFDSYLKGTRNIKLEWVDDNEKKNSFIIQIEIDPDANFSYFTSSTSINDGTLLFLYENMDNCVIKVIGGQTYYSKLRPPQSGDIIKYTVGNFVIVQEYDENGDRFTPEDKQWMRGRDTVLLPIKMEIK